MSNIACAPVRPWWGPASVARSVSGLARTLALALQVRAERRRLLALDHAALKDMGFNKGQAHAEASRGFWDVPADRPRC